MIAWIFEYAWAIYLI